jgi:hypothetical protein
MKDASVFFVGDFSDGDRFAVGCEHADIMDLAAAGGIKRGPIKYDSKPALALKSFDYASVEVVEERVAIVKAVGHKKALGNWQLAISP